MSANNWRECPRCRKDRVQELCEFTSKVEKAYGKVSLAEFNRLETELKQMQAKVRREPAETEEEEEEQDTLREDYQLGMNDNGEFSIRYSCSCNNCDFKYAYKYTKKVL